MSAENERPAHFDGIQVLRIAAAMLVVVTHSTFYTHERFSRDQFVWRDGSIGVDIFFLISGFVMMATSGGYLGRNSDWVDFAKKRILRIVPMYWLATTIKLLIMLLIPAMVLHAQIGAGTILSSYFFLPTINAEGRFEPLLGVGWTLIFEMFFYACFTSVIYLRKNPLIWITAIFAFLAFFDIFRVPGWPAATMYLDPVLLYFPAGMAIYVVSELYGIRGLLKLTLGLAATLVVTCGYLWYFGFWEFEIKGGANNLQTMVIACLVVSVIVTSEPWIKGRVPRLILFFGEASYVLYLFHPLVAPVVPEVLRRLMPGLPPSISVLLCVFAALIAAAITHILIEKPVTLILKPWLFKRATFR
nr:acyltransferase [uncultured Albidiferax sp.]